MSKQFKLNEPKIGDFLTIVDSDTCPGINCGHHRTVRLKRVIYEFECIICETKCKLTLE